jgi:WD40 repeat protein
MSHRPGYSIFLVLLLASLSCRGTVPLPYKLPTLIPSATPRPSVFSSPAPTHSGTPTPFVPAQAGTPFPRPGAIISPSNTTLLIELASRGLGIANQMYLSPDGRFLAVGSTRGIFFYNTNSLEEIQSIPSSNHVRLAAFSPDSSLFAFSIAGDEIRFLTLPDFKQLSFSVQLPSSSASLAFIPDNSLLAVGQINGEVSVWQMEDGKYLRTQKAHTNPVSAIAFSQDNKNLLTWAVKEPAKIWSAASGSYKREIYISRDDLGNNPLNASFSANGAFLAVNSGLRVRVYSLSNGTILRLVREESDTIINTTLSPDGLTLAGLNHISIHVWKLESNTDPVEILLPPDEPPVRQVALFPAGGGLAALSDKLQVWQKEMDTLPLQAAAEFQTGSSALTSISADLQTLVIGQVDGTFHTYTTTTGELLQTDRIAIDSPTAIALSLDQKYTAAAGSDGRIVLWQMASANPPSTIRENGPLVRSLSFSVDGHLLAAGSDDKTIIIWNISEQKWMQTLTCGSVPQLITFIPDGNQLFSSGAGSSSLFDVFSGEEVGSYVSYQAVVAPGGQAAAVAIINNDLGEVQVRQIPSNDLIGFIPGKGYTFALSPDGQILAVGENRITLWNTSSGALLKEFDPRGLFGRLAFSPDGRLLTLTGMDGTIRFWGVP